MAQYTCKLVKREDVAEGTMAFHFEKPRGFQFRPGQCADLTLVNPPETDGEGNIRTFSIVSPPYEDELVFATRMRNTAFKRVLRTMPLGTEIDLEGPMGSFTLHKNIAKPGVFLTGGIGITPFLSILRQATREELSYQLHLFYSNRRPEDAAFMDVLRELTTVRPGIRFIPTMTNMAKSQWQWTGETEHINRDMLRKYLPNLQGPIYYIAGPPGMVTALREMLPVAGVDEDDIRSEEFGGY
jgi:ferredoxin-NADP reductase